MLIPWNSRTCILCLKEGGMTIEHVIPASLGGKLASRMLCKGCNDGLGHGFESRARLAPELRRAAAGVAAELGALVEALEVGAQYVTHYDDQKVVQKLRSDGQFGAAKLADQSLIVPEAKAVKHITSILRKNGATEQEVSAAIAKWSEAEGGSSLDVGQNVFVRKWMNHPSTPTYTETAMSPLVPLKTAYEFVALILGTAILQPAPGLDRIREALRA